jgi:hypothetical protein
MIGLTKNIELVEIAKKTNMIDKLPSSLALVG